MINMERTDTTPTPVAMIRRIDHREAMQIATEENRRFADQLAGFTADDWSKPTDCPLWNVRAVAAHVIGSAASQASPREFVRQVRGGRPLRVEIGSPFWWDGMNEVQVRERADRSTDELRAEWDAQSRRAVRARSRLPRVIARLPLLNLPEPVGRQPVGYLFDMGFTRAVWMHRIDLARATDGKLDIDATHDGRIVADIVAEWAIRHGEPCTLDLSGPAGGRYVAGTGGEHVAMDAIEFCRILSGRGDGEGVLRHKLPL
jgi:uncharacterized protein (TIGR03083 family)